MTLSSDPASVMVAQLQAALAIRRSVGPLPAPTPGFTDLPRPGPFDPVREAAVRLEAALELGSRLSGAARERVLALADRTIAGLPVTDLAWVQRAVVAPTAASLSAAVQTLNMRDTDGPDNVAVPDLLACLYPLLEAPVARGVIVRWLDAAFSGSYHADPSRIIDAIASQLPIELFESTVDRARRTGEYAQRYLAKLAVHSRHPARDTLLAESLELCLNANPPWRYEEMLTLLPHWSAAQLLRLAAAVRVATDPVKGDALRGAKRGPPQVCGLIEALSQRGCGEQAIALLEVLPEMFRTDQWAKLLHHLPTHEGLARAREVLAFVRSPECYPNHRAHLLADLAAHADALGLRAELLAEMTRLDPAHRGWALQRFPVIDPTTGTTDPRVLAAIVDDDSDASPISVPELPHLHSREHLALRWREAMRFGPELHAHEFFLGLVWWQPTMLALAGAAGVEAIATALLEH